MQIIRAFTLTANSIANLVGYASITLENIVMLLAGWGLIGVIA